MTRLRPAVLAALLTSLVPAVAAADGMCGWRQTNLAGVPSLAHAKSRIGPDLPVGIGYDGDTQRFSFDSPRVGGEGSGMMEIRQDLAHHSESTTVELWFDRNVHRLQVDIHDLDEDLGFARGYSDRLEITAETRSGEAVPSPTVTEADQSLRQQRARRAVKDYAGRSESGALEPFTGRGAQRETYLPVRARFAAPVGIARFTFGAGDFGLAPRQSSDNPAPQKLILGEVKFCVPLRGN